MSQWLKLVFGAAFALLVAGSLTVGARAAFAHPAPMDCLYDPPRYVGSCIDNTDCSATCRQVNGDDSQGRCISGCCQCLF
jgi:hypothetical protein